MTSFGYDKQFFPLHHHINSEQQKMDHAYI